MSTLKDEIKFPKLHYNVIIAMKGLPCMGKSVIADAIGKWAGSPVLYIDDFLCTLSREKDYTFKSPPPNSEAAHRLHELAFGGLCKAASHCQRRRNHCVVIKSRLDSPFELKQLAQLGLNDSFKMILIIECRTKNEYRWQRWFEGKLAEPKEYWHKPESWKDIREYRDNFLHGPQLRFDLHFDDFLQRGASVMGIELDPFDDLTLNPTTQNTFLLTSSFLRVIEALICCSIFGPSEIMYPFTFLPAYVRYLCTGRRYDSRPLSAWRGRIVLSEVQLPARRKKRSLCGKGIQRCLFRRGSCDNSKCGVCNEPFASGYYCLFCALTLHESCALLRGFQSPGFGKLDYWAPSKSLREACEPCKEEGKGFYDECYSCLYHNYLKEKVFPTIVKHDSHSHQLSIKFDKKSVCKACDGHIPLCSYGCYWCGVSYDMKCLLLPRELEHEHGGYQHAMKLKYSRDRKEEEEGYWCNVCYRDMDPQNWFYSCQECHYEAHPLCINPSSKYEEEYASKLNETASSSTS